jgi:Chalcone and stilbene synthases, N-terminal domain
MRPDVRRMPLFGLGCVAGAAGLARAYDYLSARPDQVAVLFTVELCSLTSQQHDDSTPTLVASALFGDGAACVVLAGAEHDAGTGSAGPRILGTRSHLYPDSGHLMGWTVRGRLAGIGAPAGLYRAPSAPGTPPGGPKGLWPAPPRDGAGADIGEIAEVDGGDRDNRQSLAHRDHRSVGAAQVPVGVASHELSHAAKV